jgi:hypothetical protein
MPLRFVRYISFRFVRPVHFYRFVRPFRCVISFLLLSFCPLHFFRYVRFVYSATSVIFAWFHRFYPSFLPILSFINFVRYVLSVMFCVTLRSVSVRYLFVRFFHFVRYISFRSVPFR